MNCSGAEGRIVAMNTPENKRGDRSRDEVLAGEYVLGVLREDERQAVELRLASDRAFASMVNRWEENLTGLDDRYGPDLVPPVRVFAQMEEELFGPDAPVERISLWRSLTFWRGTTLATLAVALLLLVEGPNALWNAAPGAPSQAARLSSEAGAVGLMAYYDEASGTLQFRPLANANPQEASLELWLIDGDQPPVSLGVIPSEHDGFVSVPEMIGLTTKGATLTVTLEPIGGSKTGAPNGPIVAKGKVGSY